MGNKTEPGCNKTKIGEEPPGRPRAVSARGDEFDFSLDRARPHTVAYLNSLIDRRHVNRSRASRRGLLGPLCALNDSVECGSVVSTRRAIWITAFAKIDFLSRMSQGGLCLSYNNAVDTLARARTINHSRINPTNIATNLSLSA